MNQTLSTNNYFTKNNIQLYYNSISKELNLTNSTVLIQIELYSVLGKKVVSTKITNSLPVYSLPTGIYFYQLSKNNTYSKGKILIR